jgi:chorismate mutase
MTRPWEAALARLDAPEPPDPEAPSEADLAPWRTRIDALDEAVLCLLNERARCAAEIGRIKRRLGLPVYMPAREGEVVRKVLASNAGPLPPDAVRRLFERIIDETRSLERRLAVTLDALPPADPSDPA